MHNRVTLNVGGVRYTTFASTLQRIPNTRLSTLTKNDNAYDAQIGEYFFDRSGLLFEPILNYYRTGVLHVPSWACSPAFSSELRFWGVEAMQIEACCWAQYKQFEDQLEDMRKVESCHDERDSDDLATHSACSWGEDERSLSQRIWTALERPSSSIIAKVYSGFSLILVLLAGVCLESHGPEKSSIGGTSWISSHHHQMEYIANAILTVELTVRIIVCPSKAKYFNSTLNCVETISVTSTWLMFFLDGFIENGSNVNFIFIIIAILRFLRLLRVFRITKYYTNLRILLISLRESFDGLILFFVFVLLTMLIFATFIQHAEQSSEFPDIFTGFWWAVITMTTVGYGDRYPKTQWGRVLGCLCALTGIIAAAVPLAVVSNTFSQYYLHYRLGKRLEKRDRLKTKAL